MRLSLKARVERRLRDLGLTAAEATRRGGLGRTLIYEILNGTTRHVRVDTAEKLARGLDCDLAYVTGEQFEPRREAATEPRISYAKVVGDIAAGVWHEVSPLSLDAPENPTGTGTSDIVPVVPSPQYVGMKQFAVRVKGQSVNRVIADGEFAIWVPYEQARDGPREGDLVVVERVRGGLHEATLKRLRKNNGAWELCPDSTDPQHRESIKMTPEGAEVEHADITVQIRGLVIGKYAPL